MDLIDLRRPGLYEAVITDVGEDTAHPRSRSTATTCSGWSGARWTTSARSAATTTRRTICASPPPRACRRSISASTAARSAPVVRATDDRADGGDDARQLHPEPPAVRPVLRRNPFMQRGQAAGGDGARRSQAGRRRTTRCSRWSRWFRLDHAAPRSRGATCATRMTEAIFLTTYGSPWLAGAGRASARRRR